MKLLADPRYQRVLKWISALMALAYLVLGTAVLLAEETFAHLPRSQKLALGIILLCYGLFRAYRFVYTHIRNKKEKDEA